MAIIMSYVKCLRTFVRVYELGSMSAAGRDLRISAAVSSSRISELEKHLGVRLFVRTTRKIAPTRQGELFYKGAIKVLDTIEEVEGGIADITSNPKGTLFVSAPLVIGKKLVAPLIPKFREQYPDVFIRLRLTDRKVDVAEEGLDAAFVLGTLGNSELRIRGIHEFERVLCASPSYVAEHGEPKTGDELLKKGHQCLLLRYPGTSEFFWTLMTDGLPKKYSVSGPLESDDGDVLTDWALGGFGIVNKTIFEVSRYLEKGELVLVCKKTPPSALPFSCIYQHRRLQDPKTRLFIEFILQECKTQIQAGL